MTGLRKAAISVVLVLLLLSSALADDIGLIALTSQSQVEQATAILGHAYGKFGGEFLVILEGDQTRLLDEAGIAYEILLRDVDPENSHIILPPRSHTDVPGIRLDMFGRTVELGHGARLVQMSRVAASTLSDTSPYKVIPITEYTTAFHYMLPAVPTSGLLWEEYPTDSLVARISQDSVYAFDTRLEDFYTRYIWTDSIDRARDWLVGKFHDWGYTDVTTPPFEWGGGWHYNVKAVKPGQAEANTVIVVGAHYDAFTHGQPEPPTVYAPGADDNASGTAMTLELARVLADVPLRKTIIFMPFSAEEVGIVGSSRAARDFRVSGTNIEVMFNADMIGYTGGAPWNIDLQAGEIDIYRQITAASAGRVTSLSPVFASLSFNSDHASFYKEGFNIVDAIESNFNYAGWHTRFDISSRMDFPYLTDVVRMLLASVLIVAESPSPATVENIVDIGDGQSLEIHWSNCYTDNIYIIYRGTSPGTYVDSVQVGPGACSYIWTGLTEGVRSYFLVVGVAPGGYRSLYAVEGSELPLVYPRSPQNLVALADSASISLIWEENTEADLAHYNLYRRITGIGDYRLYRTDFTVAAFTDTNVVRQVEYGYRVAAVDLDGHESGLSEPASAFAATFDGGLALIDAFSEENQYIPEQLEQEAYFDSIMGDQPYGLLVLEEKSDTLTRSGVGPFSSLFWIDDDPSRKTIRESEDVLTWYAGYNTNILVSGYWTIQGWADTPVPSDHILYNEFRLSGYYYWGSPDFVGAHGQDGWPSIQIDPARGMDEWPNIPILFTLPGATVIYTYDSYIDYPDFEGEPVGIAYEGPNGKRVLLSFPLYYLTPASAQLLMSKVVEYFDEAVEPVSNGDADGDGLVDIADLTVVIDYLFVTYTPLPNPNGADVDASCDIDIGDLTGLIAYLFMGGYDLQPGCVE